jgi:mutator protein MutT
MVHPLDFFKFCPHCGSSGFQINNENSKKCGGCGFVLYKNPLAAVACIIRDDMGRIMVMRRAKNPAVGTLDLPGGFVDLDETAESAVVREVQEETNLDVEIVRFLFSLPNHYDWMGYDTATLDMFFECRVVGGELNLDKSENSEIMFLAPDDINLDDFGFASIRTGLTKFLNNI